MYYWLLRLLYRGRSADAQPVPLVPSPESVALEFLDALHEGAAACVLDEANGQVIRKEWSRLRHTTDLFQQAHLDRLVQTVLKNEVIYLVGGGGILRCWTDGRIVDGRNCFQPGTERIPLDDDLLERLDGAQAAYTG